MMRRRRVSCNDLPDLLLLLLLLLQIGRNQTRVSGTLHTPPLFPGLRRFVQGVRRDVDAGRNCVCDDGDIDSDMSVNDATKD